MELKDLAKEWRIWVLALALLGSTLMLFPFNPLPYEQGDNGEVNLVTNINEGLDLKGGTRVLLSVQEENVTDETVEQIKNILERRVSAFGLTQTSVRTVQLAGETMIQMEIASTNQTQLQQLVSQEGKFEARLPIEISDRLNFSLEETYEFQYQNEKVTVDGTTYSPGDDFTLENTRFYYINNTEIGANLHVVAYNGEQVEQVLTSDSRVTGGQGNFQFSFPVIITSDAAQNVQRVSNNYPTTTARGQPYLGEISGSGQPAQLMLYVDEEIQSSLNVGAVFKQQVITQPSINGGGETSAQARQDMKELQAILQSGRLPAPIQIDNISTISSSLGGQFMSAAIISIIASLIAVGGLIYLRYDDPRLVLPIVVTGASEVYILLGVFFSSFITLDLASIAGIIAAVGTGVDDQIIITDESGRDKIRDWSKRLKRAFFVIFTSAASTIGAMMPIVSPSVSNLAIGAAGIGLIGYDLYTRKTKPHHLLLGALAVSVSAVAFTMNPSSFALQSVRGFAITTILGVLVGITITRPAYAKFLEYLED
jgi:preprotein translocase subunit SecD